MGVFSVHTLCEDITRDAAVCVQNFGGSPKVENDTDTGTVASCLLVDRLEYAHLYGKGCRFLIYL